MIRSTAERRSHRIRPRRHNHQLLREPYEKVDAESWSESGDLERAASEVARCRVGTCVARACLCDESGTDSLDVALSRCHPTRTVSVHLHRSVSSCCHRTGLPLFFLYYVRTCMLPPPRARQTTERNTVSCLQQVVGFTPTDLGLTLLLPPPPPGVRVVPSPPENG
jgi:hypothetical protein